ncbi:MAG: DUF5591 domain-containing protein [Candidatus Thorarchaeota archaeon]
MTIPAKKIIIPPKGKEQVDLNRFNFEKDYRNSLFTLYLPCARDKPYHKSATHSYIKLKIKEFIPLIWRKLIRICTISEVIGIIPEKLENSIFYFHRDEFYYEHYPSYQEGDVERTAEWLKNYIDLYGTEYNFGYCTSKVFREICKKSQLDCYPKHFIKESALFEYRKTINVKQLMDAIYEDYKNSLISRFKKWMYNNTHSYQVLEFIKENNPISLRMFKNHFRALKNPHANINTFCNESKSDKGIYFYYSKKDRKYHLPKFILEFLDFQ